MTIFPLIIGWALSFGYVPEMSNRVRGELITSGELTNKMTVCDIGISASYGPLSIFTNFQNFQYFDAHSSAPLSFFPVRVGYAIGAKYSPIKWLELSASHTCEHPVSPGLENAKYPYNASITTIAVKISGETTLWGVK